MDDIKKGADRSSGQTPSSMDHSDIVAARDPKAKQPQLISIMRAMRYSQAIASIGRDAYAIICYVAERCDEAFWRGPVPLFNGQLSDALAFGSWRSLERARAIAIESGWLTYRPGSAKTQGLYYVVIPAHVMPQRHMNDRTSDETTYQSAGDPAYQSAGESAAHVLPNTYDLKPKEEEDSFSLSLSQKEGKQDKPKTSKGKKQKRPVIDPLTFEIPAPFRTEEIQKAWADYCEMRPTSKVGAIDTLRKCNLFWDKAKGYQPAIVLKAITIATAKEWGDMFPENLVAQPPQRPQAPPQLPKPLTGNRPPRNRDYSGVAQ